MLRKIVVGGCKLGSFIKSERQIKVGVSNVNLSKIKTGKISAIRFSTLEAICDVLNCQPGDILEYQRNDS
jgi:putative transcriptional regulator